MGSGSNLTARLAAIREMKREKNDAADARPETKRRTLDALSDSSWERVGTYTWERTTILDSPIDETMDSSMLLPPSKNLSDVLFLDLETTGLSTGAGNVVFLAGFGLFESRKLVVKQFFLADFPGESEFLGTLSNVLSDDAVYVSYNGKGFDSHILSSRFLINGMQISFPLHLDLLHYSRRLWKRTLGCCTLANIEERVLSVNRKDDIPGYLVPETYAAFLKTGDPGELYKVFNHNRQDIASLASLLLTIESILSDRYHCSHTDTYGVGKLLLDLGRAEGEEVLYQNIAKKDFHSAKLLSLYLKSSDRIAEAVSIWNRMWKEKRSVFAGIELAKYYEHRSKQYHLALEIVDSLLTHPVRSGELKDQLLWRQKRLTSKMASTVERKSKRE